MYIHGSNIDYFSGAKCYYRWISKVVFSVLSVIYLDDFFLNVTSSAYASDDKGK